MYANSGPASVDSSTDRMSPAKITSVENGRTTVTGDMVALDFVCGDNRHEFSLILDDLNKFIKFMASLAQITATENGEVQPLPKKIMEGSIYHGTSQKWCQS